MSIKVAYSSPVASGCRKVVYFADLLARRDGVQEGGQKKLMMVAGRDGKQPRAVLPSLAATAAVIDRDFPF